MLGTGISNQIKPNCKKLYKFKQDKNSIRLLKQTLILQKDAWDALIMH